MSNNKTESQKKLSRAFRQVKKIVPTMEPKAAVKFLLEIIDAVEEGVLAERDLEYIKTKTKKTF